MSNQKKYVTSASMLGGVTIAPTPAPRPLHLKPKPKPKSKPSIVPRTSIKTTTTPSTSNINKSTINRVQDLAKKFENSSSSPATKLIHTKPSSKLLGDKHNLSKSIISRSSGVSQASVAARRIPSVERRYSKPQQTQPPTKKRYYFRSSAAGISVTRKRSSLIRRRPFRSTGDLIIAYSSLSPSTSKTASIACGLENVEGKSTRRHQMIKSKSANDSCFAMDDEEENLVHEENDEQKVIGGSKITKRPPPIPSAPPKKSLNITVVRVTSMTTTGSQASRPNQAPPKPPPKPSKIMLAKTLRHLRPISPGADDENQSCATNNRTDGVEPKPSTSSSSNEHDLIDSSTEVKKLPEKSLGSGEKKSSSNSNCNNWLRSRSSIRKPSIRPPPPPVSPKPPQPTTGKVVVGKATWQQQQSEKNSQTQNQLRQSTSSTDLYQAMPSPEDPEESIWGSEVKPMLPSMPPPSPPKPKPKNGNGDDEHFEEVYEDIDIGFNPAYCETTSSRSNQQQQLRQVPYSPKYQKRVQHQKRPVPHKPSSSNSSDRESSIYHAYASDQGEDIFDHGNHGMAHSFNDSWGESNNLSAMLPQNSGVSDKRKLSSNHFGTWGRRNKSINSNINNSKNHRPQSSHGGGGASLELEKLLRIKSEIQLNISRKVDKIKLKVSHSPATLSKASTRQARTSAAMGSGNNLNSIFSIVDPKILQTDLPKNNSNNDSPSTSQRHKHEAYLYGDNWSSDEENEENDDIDEVYSSSRKGGKHLSSGSPSIIYSSTSNNSSSTTNNYPIEKSKSAGHALNFWKSIDSALTIGKRNKEPRATCLPPAPTPTTTFNGPPPSPPKSSLLDEIESEYMATTEFFRHRDKPPAPDPSTSTSISTTMSQTQPLPPPTATINSLLPSRSFPNLNKLHHHENLIDNHIDSEDDEDEDDHHLESELIDEDALDSEIVANNDDDDIDEDLDEMPSDALELLKKQTYQSRLPEPQPLYQIYMLHEQEKMLEVGATATISGSSLASSSGTGSTTTTTTTDIGITAGGGESGIESSSYCCGSSTTTTSSSAAADNEDTLSSIIRRQSSSISTDSGRGCDSSSNLTSNTSMRRERLTAASIYGSQRSLWCELPEVKLAGLLETLDGNSKNLQEAFFEVITSEASYLRSINVLISHFISTPEFLGNGIKPSIITAAERKHLFSNIISVRDCSEQLLCELENRLEENLILSDVCDILCEHFEKYFEAYVKYCSNQVYQDRTLKRLKAMNPQFLSVINRIESDRRCQGLDMRSFLMLPMQRITRYPLLVYAILERVPANSEVQRIAAKALMLANQVVRNCNEGARRMERTEQLLDIERRLIYKSADLKRIPLVTSGRYVVKNGQVLQIFERRSKNLLQSKQKTRNLYLFLFSDLLLIAKKRLNGTFVCKDYAQRRFVVVEPVEPHSHKVPIGAIASLPSKSHLFVCVLLQNAYGKQVEFLFNVESESDRERWLTAMRPPTCSNPDEKIYAEWDCPQAVAVHHYAATQEDELELEPGDLVNILRKMPDGWFYGERTRDGKGGWFPSSYVQQVLNDHVRANNYKQRLKVIEAAAVYRVQQQAAEKSATIIGLQSELITSNSNTAAANQNNGGGATPLIDRLRRLSNPRGFFVNL